MNTKKIAKVIHWFFYGLLFGLILFEVIYFLKLQPPSIDKQDFKVEFKPEVYTAQLKNLSLEEKVGRLFIIGFEGVEVSSESLAFFKQHNFVNFLLLGKNIERLEQIMSLNASLADLATVSGFPGLITVDQEGGQVSRITFSGMDNTPQSQINDPDQAFFLASKRGKLLANLGFNVNFSPCLEVVREDDSYMMSLKRVFPGNEQQVFLLGQRMVEGYQGQGVLAVVKHFPGGLGRVKVDPHLQLPVLDINSSELIRDLLPFKKAIEAGELKALMVTHLLYSQIDASFPSSLSENFIRSILRRDLGFNGVVVADDLNMKAISNKYSIEFAVKQSFLAGTDLMIISADSEAQVKAYKSILEAVKKGEITEKRLDESLLRILKLMVTN